MQVKRFVIVVIVCSLLAYSTAQVVVNTWPFTNATDTAWEVLMKTEVPLDAVEEGLHRCEVDQCDGSVGWGGSPNEDGDTTLDAMIMCGKTRRVGSVANLKFIKPAIRVARKVMTETYHTLLVGEDAALFADKVGFQREDLSSNQSRSYYEKWLKHGRKPNYWRSHDQYKAVGHDTIGMITIGENNDVACGTSTNGLSFRIAGRVGDTPIIGSGAYCENGVGGCTATGNGDVIMRFLPAYHAVLLMRYSGMHPREASRTALDEISKFYSEKTEAFAGLVCVNMKGETGAAAIGQFRSVFKYSLRNSTTPNTVVLFWDDKVESKETCSK